MPDILPTRILWRIGLSMVACLAVFWMIPAGMPVGFVPVALFGIAAVWMYQHHRYLERQLEADVELILGMLAA